MKFRWKKLATMSLAVAMLATTAACGSPDSDGDGELPQINPSDPQPEPEVGETNFVSADGRNGEATQDNADRGSNNGAGQAAPDSDGFAAEDAAEPRTVEEGDIYRVSQDDGLILNLNRYRGLQIIDFSDPAAPDVIGRVQVSGTPVEMYQVGDRVFMMLNNWRGYWGNRNDIQTTSYQGGLVLAVDVSDPTTPKVTGRAKVPGYIKSSRLTRGGGKEALFVVASEGGETYVESFSVSSNGKLAGKTQLDLGGYVTDIQATPERLLVARHDWSLHDGKTEVSIIDITDPNGTMVEGDSVVAEGFVRNKFNMDVHKDVLRIVSGNNWGNSTNTNHVETFDASDIHNLTRLDHATFGDDENLFATLFMGEKAFFVTYRRVDPFHAFHIAEDGTITEKSEFIVSGWNDFFRPVAAGSRLIGIGKNDENGGATMAVSLYDITDLTNPDPMITRKEIDLDRSWSEANWDDRAFTVLEKGTAVTAPTGELETGLVLLPFSGYDYDEGRYVSAVQIFTFSDTTLTKRGVMDHGSRVRRSFMAHRDDNTTGNLSEAELSLFDTTDPNTPIELGRVELAPNYSNFVVFGDYGVRRHDNSAYYGWWGRSESTDKTDSLQIVPLSKDVDSTDAVAEIEVPSDARVYKVGEQLVSISREHKGQDGNDEPIWESNIQVWDFSLPTMPTLASTLQTDELPQGYYYGDYYYDTCFNCSGYYYGYGQPQVKALDDALVFVKSVRERELEGTEKSTSTYPKYNQRRWEKCYDENYEPNECTYLSGSIRCRQLTRTDGTQESEVCTGAIYECTQDDEGERDCEEYDFSPNEVETNTYERERYRYWNHYDLHTLDLSDPSNPTLPTPVKMKKDEEAVSLLARDDALYLTYKEPVDVQGDSRPYVRYFFRTIDFSDASNPQVGSDVNIPGEVIEVDGDTVITRDFLWGENIVETSLNKLKIQGNTAYLKAVRRFADQQVREVLLDGAGHVLVSHQVAWLVNRENSGYDYEEYDRTTRLSVLDMNSPQFAALSETDIDDWAKLRGAVAGRALFTVPGGMLIVNLDDPASPYAQAFFALRGWPREVIVNDRELYVPAGPYGLYTVNADTFNLLKQD